LSGVWLPLRCRLPCVCSRRQRFGGSQLMSHAS
jgi:hypothetical protein